jgi:hypothetical protein
MTCTDVPAVRFWGVTGPEGRANLILLKAVRQVKISNDLDRSYISNFMVGDGMTYSDLGVPVVNLISHNAFQFTRKNIPEAVMKEDLPKLVEAFVGLMRQRRTFASRPSDLQHLLLLQSDIAEASQARLRVQSPDRLSARRARVWNNGMSEEASWQSTLGRRSGYGRRCGDASKRDHDKRRAQSKFPHSPLPSKETRQ